MDFAHRSFLNKQKQHREIENQNPAKSSRLVRCAVLPRAIMIITWETGRMTNMPLVWLQP